MYAKTGYGPGNIAALSSGAALSYGPTISSNDPVSAISVGGSRGAYAISPVSGINGCGCGSIRSHLPVPVEGLGGSGLIVSFGVAGLLAVVLLAVVGVGAYNERIEPLLPEWAKWWVVPAAIGGGYYLYAKATRS